MHSRRSGTIGHLRHHRREGTKMVSMQVFEVKSRALLANSYIRSLSCFQPAGLVSPHTFMHGACP